MADVSDRIKMLEREMNISMLSPWKVVAGFVGIAGLIILVGTWWFRPSFLKNDHDEMCNTRLTQFCIAIVVGLASIAWLLWKWYQG